MVGNSNDETNFPHDLLLTNTQVSSPRKAFANSSSANTKFSKTQLSKMIQLGGFVGTIPKFLLNPEYAAKKIVENRGNIISTLEKALNVANKDKNILARPDFSLISSSRKTLTNNKIKDIAKVIIRSLEKRGISLKRTTRNINSQDGFFNFLRPLMMTGLPLM